MTNPVPITVPHCPRCERPHTSLLAREFKRQAGAWVAWAWCPQAMAPILIREVLRFEDGRIVDGYMVFG